MKKLYTFILFVSLAVCAGSLPLTAKTRSQKTSKKNLKKKRKEKPDVEQTDSFKDYLKWGILPVVLAVGGIWYYNKNSGAPGGGDAVAKYKAFIASGKAQENLSCGQFFASDNSFMAKVKQVVDAKDKSNWQPWILERNDELVKDAAAILHTKKVDITKTTGYFPELGGLEHGGIDGDVIPLEMAFVVTQVLNVLEDVTNPAKAKEIVNARKNRVLANLVDRHGSNTQSLTTVQTNGHGGANCIPAIYVLLNRGQANAEDKPKYDDGALFKAGDTTIIEAAATKKQRQTNKDRKSG